MINLDGSPYDWAEGVTKESFENMLTRSNIQEFVCHISEDEFIVYLIDRQKREITKISNRHICKFFYHKVCMTNINNSYINMFLELGGFKICEWC